MAKVNVDVLLKDGTDETTFINDVTSNSEVDLVNRLPNSPTLVILDVEESYFGTLRSHSSVVSVEVEAVAQSPVTYPSKPSLYTSSGKSVGGTSTGSASIRGDRYLSFQHFLDTDLMVAPERTVNGVTGSNVGFHYYFSDPYGQRDQMSNLGTVPSSGHGGTFGDDQTYSSYYTGKNVDIIALEGGSEPPFNDYVGYHNHIDWDDPDNPGTTRCIPTNWPNLTDAPNNQVSAGLMMNVHSCGTLGAAGGLVGGFAKKAKLHTMFLTNVGITAALDSVKAWHSAKSTNSSTGLKDPTVLILEWQHTTLGKEFAIKIEDIDSVTDPDGGTTNRHSSGWGSDFTPFTSRLIFPFQLQDPDDNSWHWVVPLPRQTQASYHVSLEQMWDDGIVIVCAAGNNGHVFVKDSDPRWSGTRVTISGSKTLYTMDYNSSGSQDDPVTITKSTTSSANWYPLRIYGPAGIDKAINVAAGQNSEGAPTLDFYTGRGPGIDLIGRGRGTFFSAPFKNKAGSDMPVFAGGYRWWRFSGTSCAMPTVAGKAACYMEKHYTLHGTWPTADQVKNSMIAEARSTSMSVSTVNWENVPVASGTDILPDRDIGTSPCLKISSASDGTRPNAGFCFGDHAGTPNRQAHWTAKDINREHTYKKSPTSGVLYPRPRKFQTAPQEQAAE